MVSVRINGEEAPLKAEELGSVSEIIELIKSTIDPQHMITNMLLNGNELEETDWTANAKQFETLVIEVETGTPEEFVRSRLAIAWEVVRAVYSEFRDARKSFQNGDMVKGNKMLVQAVTTAKAFFEWYGSIVALVPENKRAQFDISEDVRAISEICKRLCQQQLYQSWWALGETIQKDLEPRLDNLEDTCRKFQAA